MMTSTFISLLIFLKVSLFFLFQLKNSSFRVEIKIRVFASENEWAKYIKAVHKSVFCNMFTVV